MTVHRHSFAVIAIHWLSVVLLLAPTTGLLDLWAHGRAVPLAGGWMWPVPFEVPGRELWGEAHEALAWALVWLVCVHMAAAAWHGWVLHDTTLKRIWFGR